jgi:hypothetical protein
MSTVPHAMEASVSTWPGTSTTGRVPAGLVQAGRTRLYFVKPVSTTRRRSEAARASSSSSNAHSWSKRSSVLGVRAS